MKVLKFFRGILIIVAIVTGLLLIGIVFKVQIATALGNYLIYEDANTEVEAAFVLAGLPNERLPYAKNLYEEGLTPRLGATGERIDPDLEILNMPWTDAYVAKKVMIRMGVDSSDIDMLEEGTNTFEESEVILDYCKKNGLKKIMIVSSQFHTRRIKHVFKKKFKNAGIQVIIKGAPPKDYAMDQWWLSNSALSFAMNECIKILYYQYAH